MTRVRVAALLAVIGAACQAPATAPAPSVEHRVSALTTDVDVTLIDGFGNPVADEYINAVNEAGYIVSYALTDANGHTTLSVDEGTYVFRAIYHNVYYDSAACTVPSCASVTIQIMKPVQVTVTDGFGAPLAGQDVSAVDANGYGVSDATTDSLGIASVYVTPGSYLFRIIAGGSYFDSSASADCVVPGCVAASIAVTHVLVTVTGTDGNPAAGVTVAAVNEAGYEIVWTDTDASGHADVFVPAGAYKFRVVVNGDYFESGPDGHCVVAGCLTASITVPACTGRSDGATCDDRNPCTQSDACQTGVCTGANPVVCTASDQCHEAGTCDPASGQCTNPVKLDQSAGPFWNDKATMPTPRSSVTGVALGGLSYVFGGCTEPPCGDAVTATVEAYDPVQDTWTPRAPLPTARDAVAAAALGGTVYVIGGFAPGASFLGKTTVDAYDPAQDSWTSKAPLNIGRSGATVGAIGGKLYVFGGHCCNDQGTIPPDFVDSYDPATDTWTARGPVPTERWGAAYGVIGGKIYVAGGLAPDRTLIDTLEAYDPATDTWTSLKRMPSAMEGPAGAVVDGKLYVIGGSTASSHSSFAIFSQVYIYDPAADAWSAGPTMTTARYEAAVTVQGQTIFLAGGYAADGPTTVVDALSPLRGPSCNDGNACTLTDICQAGTCTGANPVVCAAPQDPCHVAGTCNPADGTCSQTNGHDGLACDDGNRCTSGDSCQAGTCLPGATNVCTDPGQAKYVAVTDLGSTQGLSYATGINNHHVVVGSDVPPAAGVYERGAAGSRGFLWSESGGKVYLPWPAQAQSYANSINDTGVISVSAGIDPGALFPCRYDPAVDTQPVCQSTVGFSTGINEAGTVTGWISQPGFRMFRLDAGAIEILPSAPSGGTTPDAYGVWIDTDGTVVGMEPATGAVRYMTKRGPEALASLLPPGSDWTLNNPAYIRSGEIGGWGLHGGHERAFRIKTIPTEDVTSIDMLPMPATFSPDASNLMAADAKNAVGEIVGTIWDSGATFPEAAFVYTDLVGSIDLNTLVDPQSGWTLLSAWGINDHHEVVGIGNHGGAYHAYKLTLPDLSDCATDACHVGVRDPLTGTCSLTPKPDGSACDDGNACTQGDVCTAGSCQGATTFACVAPNTCQDTGTCDPATPSSGPPSTQDLIGWWKLDGDGRDASGGGHDLTIEGNVTPVPGRVGLGMQFDGTSCMTTPIWPEARMQGASGVTMMAWVNPSASIVCPGGQTAEAVMGRSFDYSLGSWCYPTPGIAATGTVRTAGAQMWGYPGGLGLLTPNQWTHVAVTWDHNQITIYVNGNANGLSKISYGDPGAFGDVDSTFAIGCLISYYFTFDQRIWNFKGAIDEAMLYRRVLSPAEILAYYTTSDPCTHPVHPDGSSCTDFSMCTRTDTCQAGACVGADPVVCTADQCHTPGTCVSYLGTCTDPTPVADGTTCNDGNACTRSDVCTAGACVGANPTVCLAQDGCHTATCDPGSGQCASTTNNGGTCDLGAFDYDKAGRLIRDRGAELHYDAYDQLREVLPIASPPAFTNLPVDDLWTPGDGETQALVGHSNSKGHVPVDVSLAAGGYRALLVEGNGAPIDLTAAIGMGTSVYANSMNDADAVIGTWAPSGINRAYRYDATGFHDLGNPGDFTFAYDINNQNQASGAFTVGGNSHGYRHSDATGFQEIGTLGGAQSWGWRIDDLGIVSGSAQTPDSPSTGFARFGHAVLWHDLVDLQDLNAYVDPMSGTTLVVANEKQGDYVVGVASTTGIPERAYRLKLSNGALDDDIGWAGSSFAYSVNSAGDAVGSGYVDAAETIQAAWILSDRTGFAKLNDLIDPTSGWDLRLAASIDDFGDVVGWGYHNGRVAAFRLRIPAHSSGTGGPTVAEVHTYGYDGLRTSTTTAPGTTNAHTQVWFTQDYTEHDGKREHYIRIGDRLIARVTTQPNSNGGGAMAAPVTKRTAPHRLPEPIRSVLPFALMLAALAGVFVGYSKRRRRWVPALAGTAALLLGAASCEMLGLNRRSSALDWSVATDLTHFFHQGIAPGPTLITDSTGALVEERRYEPFGQPIPRVDVVSEPQNILGRLTDPNTGWSYHGARWMQPQTARWTAPDSAIKGPDPKHLASPWDLNPYQYVRQNPLVFWDPDGADGINGAEGGPAPGSSEPVPTEPEDREHGGAVIAGTLIAVVAIPVAAGYFTVTTLIRIVGPLYVLAGKYQGCVNECTQMMAEPNVPSPAASVATATTSVVRYTTEQIGRMGEQAAASYLSRAGYTNLRAIQNASGHGIDIIAELNGKTFFFEVKSSAGAVVKGLSDAQKNIGTFVRTRLGRAAAGSPPTAGWSGIAEATRKDAQALLQKIKDGTITIAGQVLEVSNVGSSDMKVTSRPW